MRKIFYFFPKLGDIARQRDESLLMVKSLELEKTNLQREIEGKDAFSDIFLSPWTDSWKEFNEKNHEKIPLYLEELKASLDEESRRVVDNHWEKIIYLIPWNRYKKSYLYKVSDFFTAKELDEQKRGVDLSRYHFPEGANIETPVFVNHNGLTFLPDTIRRSIKGKVIIDGGAYFGDSALAFLGYDPSKIYSFEPVEVSFQKLKETIELNKLQDLVIPVKLGIGSESRKLAIFGESSGASVKAMAGTNSQEIDIVTIDNFFEEKTNEEIGLIKLDVEGAESDVIHGALETIKRNRPVLIISVYHRPEDFFFIKPMIESLNLGYKFLVRKTSPFRVTSETVLVGYVEDF